MVKVLITLGDKPSDCKLEVNGNVIQGVTNIKAAVSMERGPEVVYTCVEGGSDKIVHIDFDPVIQEDLQSIEDKVKEETNG